MKNIITALFITLSPILTNAQWFQCLTEDYESQTLKSSSIEDWDLYSGYNCYDTPIKYIRITIHVFNKNDGTGNFPDNQNSRDWLSNFFMSNLNNKFANLQTMNLETTSPYHVDSRVRFALANIYFWNDDNGWDLYCPEYPKNPCNVSWSLANNLYSTYVLNQEGVDFKNNSIHILLGDNQTGLGMASDIGDKRWILYAGVYSRYINNQWWMAVNGMAHELGHSLGLRHTWNENDRCDDTPLNSNCWNVYEPNIAACAVPSNNMMDYNANQSALTQCQINRIHYFLLGNSGNISDCLISGVSLTNPKVNGNNIICSQGNDLNVTELQFGATASWSINPESIVSTSSGFGTNAKVIPSSSLNEIGTLNYTFAFGTFGSNSNSKPFITNKLSSISNLCGIINGIYYGSTINVSGSNCSPQTATVLSGNSVTLIASDEVNLNPGFEVNQGATFEVILGQNCP